jgi:phosphoglycolate phosphatase-like HAD superfamily hydrolase
MNEPAANRFDLIVLDWDGTLMDSAAAIVRAIVAACRDLELPEPSEARARHVIGLGLSRRTCARGPAVRAFRLLEAGRTLSLPLSVVGSRAVALVDTPADLAAWLGVRAGR